MGYSRAGDDGGAEVDVGRVESLIAERAELRAAKDFAAADAIQDRLKAMGITLKDKQQQWVVDGPKKKKASPGLNWRRKRRASFVSKLTRDQAPGETQGSAIKQGKSAVELVSEAVGAMMEAVEEDEEAGEAPPAKTPRERVLEITELLDLGVISQEEFDEKRKAIIAEVVYQYPSSPSDFGYYTASGTSNARRPAVPVQDER